MNQGFVDQFQAKANYFMTVPAWKMATMFGTSLEQFDSDGKVGAIARAQFLQEANLDPPQFLRVIDCELSVWEQAVVIIDCPEVAHVDVQASGGSHSTQSGGFTAISHTYGQHVYDAFNCRCAADCRAHVPRADPARSSCEHDGLQQRAVIEDVLGMCRRLVDAGVRYAWHDGVCIAQHDEEEVKHFIQHIGWIYANADDTVIFLHYIGRPMAPIAPPSYRDGPISRWQTRVWTFQEAALSKRRRYCVLRMGGLSLDLDDFSRYNFLDKLASWYEPNGVTEILDEPEFLDLLKLMWNPACGNAGSAGERQNAAPDDVNSASEQVVTHWQWVACLNEWIHLLNSMSSSFPTIAHALDSCSSRESKHKGDRINSILGLAKVKGFYAHKDDNVEESTMEFFKRMEKDGLAIALFTTNRFFAINERPHTWYPSLCSRLEFTPSHFRHGGPNFHTDHLELQVRSEDHDSLEVRGKLVCVAVHVTLVSEDRMRWRERICKARAMTSGESALSALAEASDYCLATGYGGCKVWLAKEYSERVLLGWALPTIKQTSSDVLKQLVLFKLESKSSGHVDFNAVTELALIGQNFSAFNLIFPHELLQFDSTHGCDDGDDDDDYDPWRSSHSFAAVMVRGEVLHSAVEKIGCFVASPRLCQVLRQDPHAKYLTYLDKLVVK